MGTLSKIMRSGRPHRSGGGKKGPRRRVVSAPPQTNIFSSVLAELECGHTGRSWGGATAACRGCIGAIDTDPEFRAALAHDRDGVRQTARAAFEWVKERGEAEARKLIDRYREYVEARSAS